MAQNSSSPVLVTKCMCEGSEPLAKTLSALEDTRSADVLRFIEQTLVSRARHDKLPERLTLDLNFVSDLSKARQGLLLVDGQVRGKNNSFSTRYVHDKETGLFTLTIGPRLSNCRVIQAANEIIAMFVRGVCTWEFENVRTGETRFCRSAYGLTPVIKPPSPNPNAWIEQRNQQRRTERRYFAHI